MSLSKQRNYYRLSSLVIDKGGQVLRKCLEEYWTSLSFSSFQNFLDSNFHLILDLYRPSSRCPCSHSGTRRGHRLLFTEQWDSLFVADCTVCQFRAKPSLKLDDIDVTLCTCLLLNIKPMINPNEKAAIIALREARNHVAHANEAAINDTDFNNKWKDISSALLYLASVISPSFENNMRNSIKELLNKNIDDEECKRLVEVVKALFRDETKMDEVAGSMKAIETSTANILSTSRDTYEAVTNLHTLTRNITDQIEKNDESDRKDQILNLETNQMTGEIIETVRKTQSISTANRTDIIACKDAIENCQRISSACQSTIKGISEITKETHSAVVEKKDKMEDMQRTNEALHAASVFTWQKLEEIDDTTKDLKNKFETLREDLDPKLLLVKPLDSQTEEHITKKRKHEEFQNESSSLQKFLLKIYHDYTDSIPLSPICPDECLPMDKIFGSLEMKEDLLKGRPERSTPTFRNNSSEIDLQHGRFRKLKSYKDLFHAENSKVKRIYLTAGAGRGKSTYCIQMIADWCNGITKQQTPNVEYISKNEQEMQNFAFLFFIPLRHVDFSISIIDMIQHVLLQDYKEFHKTAKLVLEEIPDKCLIILDGLDEWSPLVEKGSYLPGLPVRRGTEGSTLIITSRPWKLESIRCKFSTLDKVVTIEGLDYSGLKSLFRNILESWYGVSSTTHEFKEKSSAFQCILTSSMYASLYGSLFRIPLIATFFITLWMEKEYITFWMEKGELPDTMTSLYISLLKLLVVKSYGTEGCKGRLTEHEKWKIDNEGWLSSDEKLPSVLTEDANLLSRYSSLLLSLSDIAFQSLLSDDKMLVFRKDDLNSKIGKDELDVALKIGFLCQSKVPGTIHSKRVSINFFHKTLQEFFAALCVAQRKDKIYQEFCSYCQTVQKILDLSNVILFIIGLDQQLACKLSNHIVDICEKDATIKRYRRSISDDENMTILYQMQLIFFEEYKDKNEFKISDVVLFNRSINLFEPGELSMIEKLINGNIHNIKSLSVNLIFQSRCWFIFYERKENAKNIPFTNLISTGSKLEKIMIKGCIVETLKSLSRNSFLKDTLRVLKITNTDMGNYDFFPCIPSGLLLKALHPLQNLTALSLCDLTLQSSDLLELESFLNSTSKLEIFEFRHHKLLTSNGLKFDLRNNVNLKEFNFGGVACDNAQIMINFQNLENLEINDRFGSIPFTKAEVTVCRKLKTVDIDNFPCTLGHLFEVLPHCHELHSLYLCMPYFNTWSKQYKTDVEILAGVIPRLTSVEHIRMRNIEFQSTPLTLSAVMSSKLCMELWDVFMSAESWQQFIKSYLATKLGVRVYMKNTFIDTESLSMLKESNRVRHSTEKHYPEPIPVNCFRRI